MVSSERLGGVESKLNISEKTLYSDEMPPLVFLLRCVTVFVTRNTVMFIHLQQTYLREFRNALIGGRLLGIMNYLLNLFFLALSH